MAPAYGPDATGEITHLDPKTAQQITAMLERRLPEPSVPGRFFVVRGFELNPRSGKIERESCLTWLRTCPGRRIG